MIEAAIILLPFILVPAGIYFGNRWVDRMLHFKPLDPKKPIVRRIP